MDLGPTTEGHSLEGWVKAHQKALNSAYQTAKHKAQSRQEQDQARYNKKAKLAPLLPGERVLIHNFRPRARGKLAQRWHPEPFVVVAPLRTGHHVYIVRPEGKDTPTRTIHRNNLRPCPLNFLQYSQEPGLQEPEQPGLCVPPPTWWLPELIRNHEPQVRGARSPARADPPEPPETPPTSVRRSQRTNIGKRPVRYCD